MTPKRRLGDLLELVPVVVQGGVDVDGDAHLRGKYRRTRCPNHARSSPSAACCTPGRGLGLRPPRARGVARRRLAAPPAPDRGSTAARPTTSTSATGPALVFVHGLGASWQSWLENIPEFARDHRVVAMDLPGFGDSEMPDGDISIECYASWVFRLLDELGIESLRSWATRWAASSPPRWRSASPTRVQRLALVSAAVFWQDYRRAQPLVRPGAAVGRDTSPAALTRVDRRGRDAAAAARVGARHGRLPLPAPDRAGARPRAGAQRAPHGRLPARARGAGRLPARARSCPKISLPDADRLGRQRHARARSRTPSAWRS